MDVHAPQRQHNLREVFNALRWIVRAGAPWRMMPNDFPPWEAVYQQTRRWLKSGCFEAMVSDLRSIIRVAQGRQGQPSAVILDGRTVQSSCESGPRAGYDGYKRRRGSKVHMAVVESYAYLLDYVGSPCSWDNAVMERFFLNLKMERVWQRDYANHTQAQTDIVDYIVGFYNSVRLHSTLGYCSPNQFEQQHLEKQ